MSRRRPYTITLRCAENGCRDHQTYEYETRADEAAGRKRQQEHPYRCTRHARPERVLRPDNRTRQIVLVASKLPYSGSSGGFLPGLFWIAENELRSGFTYGPGFNAHADDFPEGTRLVVTAQIELPEVADVQS